MPLDTYLKHRLMNIVIFLLRQPHVQYFSYVRSVTIPSIMKHMTPVCID